MTSTPASCDRSAAGLQLHPQRDRPGPRGVHVGRADHEHARHERRASASVFLLLQAPAIFPGGNMVLAVIIGTVIMAFTLLWVYSEFAAAMPRSGGDYVFVSRALHPFLGWLLSWSQGIWLIFFWIGFNAWFALTFAAPDRDDHDRRRDRAARAGSPQRTTCWPSTTSSASTCSGGSSLFGTVLNVLFALLLIFGGRVYWRVQKWLFLLAGLAILIMVGLLLVRGDEHRAVLGQLRRRRTARSRYDQVIPAAQAAGFTGANAGFSFSATLLMLPWVFFVVGYAQGSAQIGGEVKRASRSQYFAMVGGVLINGLVLAIIVLLTTHAVGHQLAAQRRLPRRQRPRPSSACRAASRRASTSWSRLMTHNVVLLALLGIGFVIWALMGTPLSELQATRYMLAWGLDRSGAAAARPGQRPGAHPGHGHRVLHRHRRDRAARADQHRRRPACSARCWRRSPRSSWCPRPASRSPTGSRTSGRAAGGRRMLGRPGRGARRRRRRDRAGRA